MGTHAKEGNGYIHITSRQNTAKDTEDDEDGMGMKRQNYYR